MRMNFYIMMISNYWKNLGGVNQKGMRMKASLDRRLVNKKMETNT